VRKRIAALCLCFMVFACAALTPVAMPSAAAVDPGDALSVEGTHLQLDGANITAPLFGVCDTTALQFAILSWIEGQSSTYAGKNQIFPGFAGTISCSNSSEFWGKYFTLAEYYDLDLIRIGAGDKWGTDIQYEAWANHHDQYITLLEQMARYADAHGVKIILVLAGTQDYPAPYFGAADNSFTITSQAYANYITYARDTMTCLADDCGIGIIDLWNEPDHNYAWSKYWSSNGGKSAYHVWAGDIANKTLAYNWHPRLIGVADLGTMFSWGQGDFNLATGSLNFELNDRHYYAKAQDAYLFQDPEAWSDATGKPLIWTELGNNTNYPEERWPYAEQQIAAAGGQAYVAMTLLGTANYPYTGTITDTTVFPTNETEPVTNGTDPVNNGTDPQNGTEENNGTGGTGSSGHSSTKTSTTRTSTLLSSMTAKTSSSSKAFLMFIPALGAALILGSIVAPKPKKRRKYQRRSRGRRR